MAGWDDLITTTKEAEAKAPFRLPTVYKIKKVWNDEGHEDRRPDHQSFGVYYNEDLYTLHTVTARASTDEDKNWIYTWDDNGTGYQYKVREYGMTGTGSDITGRYHFMNVGNEEYSHIINPIYDDDGDLKEYDRWWYELEREEYDSEHHTWIKINTYHEEHVVRTLVPFEEQKLEVGIQKNRLNYGNYNRLSSSDRALNLLRRGDDVVVDYSVYGYGYIIELTKNVDLEGLKITDFGFRDVKLELEDNFGEDTTKDYKENTFLFDAALRLTPEDVEIAYVTIGVIGLLIAVSIFLISNTMRQPQRLQQSQSAQERLEGQDLHPHPRAEGRPGSGPPHRRRPDELQHRRASAGIFRDDPRTPGGALCG